MYDRDTRKVRAYAARAAENLEACARAAQREPMARGMAATLWLKAAGAWRAAAQWDVFRGLEVVNLEEGPGLYALVRVSPEQGDDFYSLREDYPRTNRSNDPRPRGWCGTTNNVAIYGEGCVRVVRDAKGRLRIRVMPDDALVVDCEEVCDG